MDDPNEAAFASEAPHRLCARCRIELRRIDRKTAKRAYQRDPSKMVSMKCAHPMCENTWQVWPQNVKPELLCPQVHLPLLKQQQGRERQRRHRLKAGVA